MKRVVLVLVLSLICLCNFPSYAQQAVNVRSGIHDDYTRLVFDFPETVDHQVEKTADDRVEITITSDAVYDVDLTDILSLGVFEEATIRRPQTGQVVIALTLDQARDMRDFKIGNRLVFDVFGAPPASDQTQDAQDAQDQSTGDAVQTPPQTDDSTEADTKDKKVVQSDMVPPPLPKPLNRTVKNVPVQVELPADKPDSEQAQTAAESAAASADVEPAKTVVKTNPLENEGDEAFAEPTVFTLSLTEAVGIAVYKRGTNLYYFVDTVLQVEPLASGPLADEIGAFKRVDTPAGTLYHARLPEAYKDYHFYGEGGGLVWRLYVQEEPGPFPPVDFRTVFSKEDKVRNGEVVWPLKDITGIFKVRDPAVGDELVLVTVSSAEQFAGMPHDFVDFDTFYSAVGLAVKPEADDLVVETQSTGIGIKRPDGLALSSRRDMNTRKMRENVRDASVISEKQAPKSPQAEEGTKEEIVQIFDFDRWMLGGKRTLEENQRILLTSASNKDNAGKAQDLVTLAKMNLSNNRGQEAIGFLKHAAYIYPPVVNSLEYRALRGAAYAISGKYEYAYQDLFHRSLKEYSELDYWRAYTLAWLEDWRQAAEILPDNMYVLMDYPNDLLQRIGLKLAEIALRNGDVLTAERLLAVIKINEDDLWPAKRANAAYLKGVAHSISGEYDLAKSFWVPLTKGYDDLFRAKAGLALVMLEYSQDEISAKEAIDRLEGLRFAWRGDELEAQINFMLGRLYIEQDVFMRGFTILREATSLRPDANISQDITDYMRDQFEDILVHKEDLSALDAVTLFEEFRELTPAGRDGDVVIRRLAERLVEAELMGRASQLLQHQVDFRLANEDRAESAVRLGTIYLLDKKPEKALDALAIARDIRTTLDDDAGLFEINLLQARALSQQGKAEEALETLDALGTSIPVNRLRADIAWKAGLWEDAADAINLLILDEKIGDNAPLTEEQAELILNRAVALNLAGDRVAIANLRSRFGDKMKRTTRARLFEVISRSRQNTIIADQETLRSIVSEVDMFKDFLDEYNADQADQAGESAE